MNQKLTFLSPEGKQTTLSYHCCGKFLKLLCQKYCTQGINEQKEFEEFAKQYTYFPPYFDFVLTHMHYKIANPFFRQGVLYASQNQLYFLSVTDIGVQVRRKWEYPLASDKSLLIKPLGEQLEHNALLSPYGILYQFERKDFHHEEIADVILNQFFLNNEFMCQNYSKLLEDDSLSVTSSADYLRKCLGYTTIAKNDDGSFCLIVNESFLEPKLVKQLQDFASKNPDNLYCEVTYDDETLELVNNIQESIGKRGG